MLFFVCFLFLIEWEGLGNEAIVRGVFVVGGEDRRVRSADAFAIPGSRIRIREQDDSENGALGVEHVGVENGVNDALLLPQLLRC